METSLITTFYGLKDFKMKYLFILSLIFIFYSCKKYGLPSEPKIQGKWLITRADFYRIENKDTVSEIHFYPGDLFIMPNENTPLDTINIGTTSFSCSGVEILFNPYFGYSGRTLFKNRYFYSVSEVNFDHPGFMSFETEMRKNVWKIIYTDYWSGMLLQLKGQWDQNSGFAKQVTIGYGKQQAIKYDALYIKCARIGP